MWCWPGGEVGGTEVDEEIPFPVQHGQQVMHAAQVGLQQTGPAPDGDHAPGCSSHVGVELRHLQHLSVHVVWTLQGTIWRSSIISNGLEEEYIKNFLFWVNDLLNI